VKTRLRAGGIRVGEREEDRLALLVLGRDDLLLLGYLNSSVFLSDIDTSIWRNRASLRVRLTEDISGQSAGGCFPPMSV